MKLAVHTAVDSLLLSVAVVVFPVAMAQGAFELAFGREFSISEQLIVRSVGGLRRFLQRHAFRTTELHEVRNTATSSPRHR